MGDTNQNIASGNARVGIQISRNNGVVQFSDNSTSTQSLSNRLTQVRDALDSAHAAGEIDAETYQSASTELEHAQADCPADDSPASNGFILSMRKLKGLVEDATQVASLVGSVIAAVKGVR